MKPSIEPKRIPTDEVARMHHFALAAPEGPWFPNKVAHCHQLVADAFIDDDGRLRPLGKKPVRIVLETKEGRMFLERCRDDQVALIGHVYALDDEIRELRRKADKLELDNLELIARLKGQQAASDLCVVRIDCQDETSKVLVVRGRGSDLPAILKEIKDAGRADRARHERELGEWKARLLLAVPEVEFDPTSTDGVAARRMRAERQAKVEEWTRSNPAPVPSVADAAVHDFDAESMYKALAERGYQRAGEAREFSIWMP